MIVNNEFKLLQVNNIKNGQDLFYYLWIFAYAIVILVTAKYILALAFYIFLMVITYKRLQRAL